MTHVFCKRCGCFARTKIRNLAKPCEEPTESGKHFLNNINNCILPNSGYLYSRLPVTELNILNIFQISVNQAEAAIVPIPIAQSVSPEPSIQESVPSPFSVAVGNLRTNARILLKNNRLTPLIFWKLSRRSYCQL